MYYLCIPGGLVNVLVDPGEHEGDHERKAGREEEEPQPALCRMPSALGNILTDQSTFKSTLTPLKKLPRFDINVTGRCLEPVQRGLATVGTQVLAQVHHATGYLKHR